MHPQQKVVVLRCAPTAKVGRSEVRTHSKWWSDEVDLVSDEIHHFDHFTTRIPFLVTNKVLGLGCVLWDRIPFLRVISAVS